MIGNDVYQPIFEANVWVITILHTAEFFIFPIDF